MVMVSGRTTSGKSRADRLLRGTARLCRRRRIAATDTPRNLPSSSSALVSVSLVRRRSSPVLARATRSFSSPFFLSKGLSGLSLLSSRAGLGRRRRLSASGARSVFPYGWLSRGGHVPRRRAPPDDGRISSARFELSSSRRSRSLSVATLRFASRLAARFRFVDRQLAKLPGGAGLSSVATPRSRRDSFRPLQAWHRRAW